jgi:hypothetical protein
MPLALERLKQEKRVSVTRLADASVAAAVLRQLQRSLFPYHAMALSPLHDDTVAQQIAAAAAAFDDLKMYGEFLELGQQRSLKFWREKDSEVKARAVTGLRHHTIPKFGS